MCVLSVHEGTVTHLESEVTNKRDLPAHRSQSLTFPQDSHVSSTVDYTVKSSLFTIVSNSQTTRPTRTEEADLCGIKFTSETALTGVNV